MGNRMKEEEKIERLIRSLLKLPENRRCINCNSLGPQYVCTTFMTFVCTNCSGVHREFTHRVKSVSMAKFTAKEVNSLQAGGNERARQVFLKEFDPQYHSFPDSSNVGKIRDFIKQVYAERKYTGEKGVHKPLRLRLTEEPEQRRSPGAYPGVNRSFHEEERNIVAPYSGPRRFGDEERKVAAPYSGSRNFREEDWKIAGPSGASRSYHDQDRRVASPFGGSRSLHDNDNKVQRYYSQGSSPSAREQHNVVKYYSDERNRSPRYSEESPRAGGIGFRRTPVRFEIVDNRIRDDRKARGQHSSPNRPAENKNMLMLQDKQKDNMLQIKNDHKQADASAHNQKMKSTSTIDQKAVEHKKEKPATLIDLISDTEPSDDAVKSQQQPTTSLDNGNSWASFDSSSKKKPLNVPKPSTLEASLLELSDLTPSPLSATASVAPSNNDVPSNECTNSAPAGDAPLEASSMFTDSMPASYISAEASTLCANNAPAGGAAIDSTADNMLSLFDNVSACTSASASSNVPEQHSATDSLQVVPTSGGDASLALSVTEQPNVVDPLQDLPTTGGDTSVTDTDLQQLPTTQPDQSSGSFVVDSFPPSELAIMPFEASNNLSRASLLAPNTQESVTVSAEAQSQSMPRSQSLPVVTKASQREELPMDLFAAPYPSISSQASGWPPGPRHAMGFNMHYYPNVAPAPAFPSSVKPRNPFDTNDDKPFGHSTHFSSMTSLEDAMRNVSVLPSLVHASSLGSFPSHFRPQSPNPEPLMPSHSLPSYAGFSPSPYMAEQQHNDPHFLRTQAFGGFGWDEAAAFGTLSSSQQPFQQQNITYPPNNNLDSTKRGGNPFG